MIKLFTITYLFLSVFLSTAHATKHIEASPESMSLADFTVAISQKAGLPMTKGHITWQLLSHTEDTLVYTYTVGNSRNDIDITVFARTVRVEKLPYVCPLLEAGVIDGLVFMEFIYKDYVGRDLYTLTMSVGDCV